MISFRFPDGRDVRLLSLHVHPTDYHTPQQEVDQRIRNLACEYYPTGDPPFLIRWPAGSLPQTLCIGAFQSKPLEFDEAEGYSYLVLIWFVWHLDRAIREVVSHGLSGLKWEEHARDFSWW